MKPHNQQQGVSLIEVLISVFILAVGVLGLAGLQAQSLRLNHESYYRTQLTVLANDIGDRMRANRKTAINSDSYKVGLGKDSGASTEDCEVADCTSGSLAAYDLSQWQENIANTLPGGVGAVTPLARTGAQTWREYSIQIQYDSVSSDPDNSAPEAISFSYRTRI